MVVKALIIPDKLGAFPIPVLFNPTQYSLEKTNELAEAAVPGSASPVISYLSGGARTLSMTLFCDTYALGLDVRVFTNPIYDLLAIDRRTGAPPTCRFVWGTFVFRCMLQSVNGSFTLFLPIGIPVRASLEVTFKEYVPPQTAARVSGHDAVDHTKTRPVKRGDTLSAIAAAEYGDPGLWRAIADANGIDNPRRVQAGQVLVIPPSPARSTAGSPSP